jgi:hypothetical protein
MSLQDAIDKKVEFNTWAKNHVVQGMEQWKCPCCETMVQCYPALSRYDNSTEICSRCGVMEALMGIKRKHQERDYKDSVPVFHPASIEEKVKHDEVLKHCDCCKRLLHIYHQTGDRWLCLNCKRKIEDDGECTHPERLKNARMEEVVVSKKRWAR